MAKKPKTTVVLGPPGTGKTTTLLNLVLKEMESGVPPDRIAYLAFTRKASGEAIQRALKKFDLREKDFPLFRTLHSLAYRQLGLHRDDVFSLTDLRDFAHIMGIHVEGYVDMSSGEVAYGAAKGDRMLFQENLARVRQIPLVQQYEEGGEDFGYWEVERVARGLVEYKKERKLVDYTDMIEQFVELGETPKIEVLFVDEAQDLSSIQWRMVEKLAAIATRVYIAGDDDQAIFRWAGADVNHFIGLRGNVTLLRQSYRVPQAIQELATGVVSRIKDRHEKDWAPREGEGEVKRYGATDAVNMDEGKWLVLARNNYMLQGIEDRCKSAGIYYEHKGKSPVKSAHLRAILAWERLRKGKEVQADLVRSIYDMMSSGKGVRRGFKKLNGVAGKALLTMEYLKMHGGLLVDTPWFEALDRFGHADREYVRAVLRRGEKITKEPRVKLSTIHGAKGGEADNVLLLTDMAGRTYFESIRNPGDEERVFYVGVTRARKALHLIAPQTKTYFNLF